MNIQTTEQANTFLQQLNILRGGRFDYFSSTLKTVSVIRKREKRKKKLNAVDRKELRRIYLFMYSLAMYADLAVFREVVPEQEIADWFDHVADILQQKINDPFWIRTGNMLDHDMMMLESYFQLLSHPLPAVMTFENTKILEIITSMIISRKGVSDKLPGLGFANDFVLLIHTLFECSTKHFDNTWNSDTVFKKLDATGILEQFIRCATIPAEREETLTMKKSVFRCLLWSTKFVKKRLKGGSPGGDTLRAILKGRTAICSSILPFLQNLHKLSVLLQYEDGVYCQYCKKGIPNGAYMHCGRCKHVPYCSKECQKVDWKEHKKVCVKGTTTTAAKNSPPRLSDFYIRIILAKVYVDIIIRLVKECDKAGGLKLKDMILELNLRSDECGRIPLLQDPPEFEIFPIGKYLDGTRPIEVLPAMGLETKVEAIVTLLAEKHSNGTPEPSLHSFAYHPCARVYKNLQGFTTKDKEQLLFTQEVVDAVRIAMDDDDYGPLSAIFESEERIESFKLRIRTLQSVDAGS